ncbi:MAG TPA: hypothetical protein VFC58_11425 [Desulfosporosinus sp.]|nr:hypothetical protein [Desulfosporosinus sp.]
MTLAQSKQIEEYSRKGWWGKKTLLDYFQEHVVNMPEHTALSAQEVENILMSHTKITDVAAVGMPDDIFGEWTCVFVVAQLGETLDLTEVKAFMHDRGVAIYKWPERMELIDTIPRNPTGKILKAPLRERLREYIQ